MLRVGCLPTSTLHFIYKFVNVKTFFCVQGPKSCNPKTKPAKEKTASQNQDKNHEERAEDCET